MVDFHFIYKLYLTKNKELLCTSYITTKTHVNTYALYKSEIIMAPVNQ